MKQVQRGFTMIEMVMVIGITGVLAAVAIPLFVDVRTDARESALKGTADALASVASSNYAARGMNATKGFAVTACQNVSTGLQGGLNTAYTITVATIAADVAVVCVLNTVTTPVLSANFTATGVL